MHYPDEWRKAGTPPRQVTLDELECERASRGSEHTPDLLLGGILDVVRYQIENTQREHAYSSCMRTRGYQKS